MILRKSIVILNLLNQNQLLLIKKQLKLNLRLIACQNHQINIIELPVKPCQFQWNSKMLSKREQLYLLNKMLKKELTLLPKTSVGIKVMLWKFGLSVQKIKVLIFYVMPQREFNSWTKSEIHANQLSNGQPEKDQWLKNTWEE